MGFSWALNQRSVRNWTGFVLPPRENRKNITCDWSEWSERPSTIRDDQSIRLNSPRGGYRFNWSRNAGAIPFYFQLAVSWTKSTRMRHISEVIAHWRWRVSGEMFNSFIWEENDTIWEKESYCYYWTEISDINFKQIFKMVVRRNYVIQIAHYSLMQILLAKGKSYFC